jgi:hypothetical protein
LFKLFKKNNIKKNIYLINIFKLFNIELKNKKMFIYEKLNYLVKMFKNNYKLIKNFYKHFKYEKIKLNKYKFLYLKFIALNNYINPKLNLIKVRLNILFNLNNLNNNFK